MQSDILISVIIPVKNGEYWLHDTLSAIVSQTLYYQTEIIVIDSGSTDQSLSIAKQYNVQIIEIDPLSFNHGRTRNFGVHQARGKFVVMTVQDAKPASEQWLEHLLAGFDNENIAGVCGIQIVPEDTRMNPVLWYRPASKPQVRKVHFSGSEEFCKLTPAEMKRACSWDDVNAMYRKDILCEIPFRELIFGEDMQWAKDVLKKGYSLIYTDHAKVYHYHYDSPGYIEKRTYIECYFRYKLFRFRYKKNEYFFSLMRDAKTLMGVKKMSISKKVKWLLYNHHIRAAENKSIMLFNENLKKGEDYMRKKFYDDFKISPVANKPENVI